MDLSRLVLLVAFGTLLGVVHGASAQLVATDLRCEYLADPMGLDETSPRLSWIVESDQRGARQTAYRVLVASTAEQLSRDEGDLWDTGKRQSSESIHIEYEGAPLSSRQQCYWKVMSWDAEGQPGPWSEPGRWEIGLLSPSDWVAEWIDAEPSRVPVDIRKARYVAVDGSVSVDVTERVKALAAKGEAIVATNDALGGDPAYGIRKHLAIDYLVDGVEQRVEVDENATANFANTRFPYLRRTFAIGDSIRSARLYVTALGLYEIQLNGAIVGDARLAPGWTDYRKRVHYHTYDVTDLLDERTNVIGAIVGPGWFSGRAGLFGAQAFYGDSPALLAQLEVVYADGTRDLVASDGSWRRHDGPIVVADMMDGEMHDARREIDGWSTTSVDDTSWKRVSTRDENRNLEAQPDLPVRELQNLPARAVTEPEPGRWVFDLAQNMVGVVRIRVQQPAGTVITLRHAEMLNEDGTLYLENLRGAAATDTYVCRGGGVEIWEPRFTFHGFRYVELSGLSTSVAPPTIADVTGVVLGSELPQAGTFACSDERLNQLQSNIVWGLRGNYLSIPTDCPQRDERMGWMGDAQAFIPTAIYNANVAPFMTKWMTDVRDAQREDGAHSDVAPVMEGLSYGTPAWADAGVIVPWTVYRMYGDTRILERNIESMRAWVEWCRAHSTDLIRDRDRGNDYGDWLSIDADTPKDLIGTAYFARSTEMLSWSYAMLGDSERAAEYRELCEQIQAAYAERFIDADGRIAGDTQTAYVISLRFGLVPEDLRDAATDHLLSNLRERGWRLSTGFIGVGHLLPTLDRAGYDDAAYRLLMQDEFPSWLFSVKHGATTIWERWNGWTPDGGMNDPGMNSFNHYALGSCGQWLFEGVGGIRPGTPGFSDFTIRPCIGGGLTWADATFKSMRGLIASRWGVSGETFTLRITVPANTRATVHVPATGEILESGQPLDRAEGVTVLIEQARLTILRVESGSYVLTGTALRDVHPRADGNDP